MCRVAEWQSAWQPGGALLALCCFLVCYSPIFFLFPSFLLLIIFASLPGRVTMWAWNPLQFHQQNFKALSRPRIDQIDRSQICLPDGTLLIYAGDTSPSVPFQRQPPSVIISQCVLLGQASRIGTQAFLGFKTGSESSQLCDPFEVSHRQSGEAQPALSVSSLARAIM